jgi:hypothetical protein
MSSRGYNASRDDHAGQDGAPGAAVFVNEDGIPYDNIVVPARGDATWPVDMVRTTASSASHHDDDKPARNHDATSRFFAMLEKVRERTRGPLAASR